MHIVLKKKKCVKIMIFIIQQIIYFSSSVTVLMIYFFLRKMNTYKTFKITKYNMNNFIDLCSISYS